MLHHLLFIAAVLIILALQNTSGENSNNDRPELRDRKQHKKNGLVPLRKSSSPSTNQVIPESASEKVSNFRSDQRTTTALSNFKQTPKQESSNIIHTQKQKQPKQKIVGVPAGKLASGYFLVSAWTDVGCTGTFHPTNCLLSLLLSTSNLISLLNPNYGCTGLVGGILAYALGICIPYPYSAFVTQYQIFTTYSYGTTVVLQSTSYSDATCASIPLGYTNISSNQNGCAAPIPGQPSPFIALSLPGITFTHFTPCYLDLVVVANSVKCSTAKFLPMFLMQISHLIVVANSVKCSPYHGTISPHFLIVFISHLHPQRSITITSLFYYTNPNYRQCHWSRCSIRPAFSKRHHRSTCSPR